jgi:hypothetical protein
MWRDVEANTHHNDGVTCFDFAPMIDSTNGVYQATRNRNGGPTCQYRDSPCF